MAGDPPLGLVLGFPHGNRPGDLYPSDVEPPCEGHGLEAVAANLPPVYIPSVLGTSPIDPAHYKQGNVETIEIIEHVIAGYPTHLAYHIGNVLKYLCRAPYKNPTLAEDLKKARWYLDRAVSKL